MRRISAISSEPWREEMKDPRPGHMRYWQKKRGARSIAHIRPRSREDNHERRRALYRRRRVEWPSEFRMTVFAPILQTSEVVSRVVQPDGTIIEESLNNRFVMARTVATQTVPEEMEVAVGGGAEGNAPNQNNEVDVVIDLTVDDDDQEGDDEETDGEEGEAIPAVGVNVGTSDSTGTPVQDEHYP